MRFFLPLADDDQQAEQAFDAIFRFVQDQMGPLRATRYYTIVTEHNGKPYRATVGEAEPLTRELVIAILRTARPEGPFLVCTPNRGVERGEPVLASSNARAIEFEMDGGAKA